MKYNYYTYKTETFTCKKCNWTGKGSDTFLSELSEIHTIRDIECPNCEETIFSFDLSKVVPPSGNPMPNEKVCFNCENMLWMVGIGQGLKCKLTMNNIDNRRHTCEKFEFKKDKL
jgi:hypothetical protein